MGDAYPTQDILPARKQNVGSPNRAEGHVARGPRWLHSRRAPDESGKEEPFCAPRGPVLDRGRPLVGCEAEGPAEKAGKGIDNAAQKVKDTVSPPGPMEKAGEKVDKAIGK